ncbi:MAG: hypothetical protein N0E59_00840 [Candidatus Thiodiazotropha taylori]|nr:hypothetical protein [Candidatus Thiodiazotropha taylori]MCG8109288.1 hypothetical protein [Candidatus Thiodiazotropha taylori]MCW4281626.1 hypothetical protein [Candidatus Thiodiazotropha taylori]MCW4303581.1 hypothetical protein [Candidatus Thiodiazotropha taylori]
MADEKQYLETFLIPVRKCKDYRPKFGQGNSGDGLSLNQFKHLYGSDPFYAWVGLDTDLMYAAHRAAGGMTSVYRQIGIGCERLFRAVLVDTTGYTDPEFATWSYSAQTRSGKSKKLSLDGRLELSEIKNQTVLANVQQWITDYCADLGEVEEPGKGIVFEVRQGYKSKDSKRQNADIDNATVAWANDYLPVFAIFSSQIDSDIVLRYRNNRSGILIGTMNGNAQVSLYAFCEQVLGYDLADFFKRHTDSIKTEIHDVLETLLSAE